MNEIFEPCANCDALNALNLANSQLGELFLRQEYNPLKKDFTLEENYVLEALKNKKNKKDNFEEVFLDFSNSKAKKFFINALQNCDCIEDQINKLGVGLGQTEISQQLESIKLYFSNRHMLLLRAQENLKDKQISSLAIYSDIYNLDVELGELLKDSFYENFNIENAIKHIVNILKCRAKQIKNKRDTDKIAVKENTKITKKVFNKNKNTTQKVIKANSKSIEK